MASNTKMFTSIAILQLRDAGKLHLDEPVSKYLPWFKIKPATEGDPAITIENLLTHGSGLPREAASPYWTTFNFPSQAQVQDLIASQTAAYPPDTRFKYSNLALSLAGYIVEAVSGEKYADYIDRHIFQPLGMTTSSIGVPGDRMSRLATGYGRRMPDGSRLKMPFTDCKGIDPAAGLSSTVEDMAKFVSLHFRTGSAGGAQILRGSTLREMQRIHLVENNWTRGNGLGMAVWRDHDKVYVGHGGSLAGYKTQTMIQVEDKVGVVVLSNGDDAGAMRLATRLMSMVGQPVAKAAKPVDAQAPWDPAWGKYQGLYRSMWGDEQVLETNRALVMIAPEADDPQESITKLIPIGGGVFKMDAKTGGGAIGELVKFSAESGVMTMTVGTSPSKRVPQALTPQSLTSVR